MKILKHSFILLMFCVVTNNLWGRTFDISIEKEFFVSNISFIKLYDTNNPSNFSYNPIKKDDPTDIEVNGVEVNLYSTPGNYLYLTESPVDEMFHATLELGTQSGTFPNNVLCAIWYATQSESSFDTIKIEGTEVAVSTYGVTDIIFDFPDISTKYTSFILRVGLDDNNNDILDNEEIIPLSAGGAGEPTIRGSSIASYVFGDRLMFIAASTEALTELFIDAFNIFSVSSGILNDIASRFLVEMLEYASEEKLNIQTASKLLRIFYEGDAESLSLTNMYPTKTEIIPFECLSQSQDYVEWLTHNAGADFNENGNATIAKYTWDENSDIAVLVANSPQVEQAVYDLCSSGEIKSDISTYFEDKPTGHTQTFPLLSSGSDTYHLPFKHEIDPKNSLKVDEYSVTFDREAVMYALGDEMQALLEKLTLDRIIDKFDNLVDDLNGSIARGRVLKNTSKVAFTIEKINDSNELKLVMAAVQGVVEDLYDFNREQGTVAGAAGDLQIGYGNGSMGRTSGKIYLSSIAFHSIIQFDELETAILKLEEE